MTKPQRDHPAIASIEEIVAEAANGKMFIIVDDEDRENEGDLMIPAQFATPDAVNFMARNGRGLICLALPRERVSHLGLNLMTNDNRARHGTAFTVSIEAREGITTGISAHDRAHTIQVAIDPTKGANDISIPGHVFPLVARDGGVLVRAGHTEAAVDIARLAGVNPAGVICEVMNDDGTMARLPDLVAFAQKFGLKIGTISDLIAYRRRSDRLVERYIETELDSWFGGHFRMIVYRNTLEFAEHIALVKGDVTGDEPVLTRMHGFNVLIDALGDRQYLPDVAPGASGRDILRGSMNMISDAGRGVIVLLREPRRSFLSDSIRHKLGEHPRVQRDYGIGAQILLDLGVRNIILLSNNVRAYVGMNGFGLNLVETRDITQIS